MRVSSKKEKGVYVEKRDSKQSLRRMQNYAIALTAAKKYGKKGK